jgi:hypothetical protein
MQIEGDSVRPLHQMNEDDASIVNIPADTSEAESLNLGTEMNSTHHRYLQQNLRRSHLYFLFSLFVAVLAIITPSGRIHHHHKVMKESKKSVHHHKTHFHDVQTVEIQIDGKLLKTEVDSLPKHVTSGILSDAIRRQPLLQLKENDEVNNIIVSDDGMSIIKSIGGIFNKKDDKSHDNKLKQNDAIPHWLKWMFFIHPKENKMTEEPITPIPRQRWSQYVLEKVIDPAILNWIRIQKSGNGTTLKEQYAIADKLLTSTPRLISIINLLLAFTYLMHSVVADFFLGDTGLNHSFSGASFANDNDITGPMMNGIGTSSSNRMHRSSRERLGGYLLFKLLLITAVVEPDTLDLLILLNWFTLLAFMRSLSFQAGSTIAHTSASGLPPHKGVLSLLVVLLICNCCTAAVCMTLFYQAGWSMVLLLTSDCALLLLDIVTHLMRYFHQVLEVKYQTTLERIEESHSDQIQVPTRDDVNTSSSVPVLDEIEKLEVIYKKRTDALTNAAFLFDILSLLITIFHFIHVWVLHGVTFNLVDGVLALHLHSAISTLARKISEVRSRNRISRDLDQCFPTVTDIDLQKALSAGDVCSICLGSMTVGHVKKVACGHLFHINCLREVAERARSIEAARCPLCRACLLSGMRQESNQESSVHNQNLNNGLNGQLNMHTDNLVPGQNERSVIRLSTEGLLPSWIPLPAFSFEVVHRTEPDHQIGHNNPTENANASVQGTHQDSIWRRILTLTGVMPMSPEEELQVLNSLVEIFPQLDRNQLLTELRERGSAEAVAESILGGEFHRATNGNEGNHDTR